MTAKIKTLLLVGFATLLPIGILGGYFALREALAPPDAALVRRAGLAGIYLVEQGDQKFLVNSMGGIQKLDTPPPQSQPASTPVVAVNPLDTEEAPAKALPTPPPSSYAATVLAQYRRSLQESKQFAEYTVSVGEQSEGENPQRSSFVHDKQATVDPSPTSSPVQGETPTPTPAPTPTPRQRQRRRPPDTDANTDASRDCNNKAPSGCHTTTPCSSLEARFCCEDSGRMGGPVSGGKRPQSEQRAFGETTSEGRRYG